MRIGHFFIDRPVFAAVISLLITIVGGIAYFTLPVSEYPEIAPPTIVVNATYPGASAEVIAETVAAPLEQEINGVDDMLYIASQSTGDGRTSINVVFRSGADIDKAQVLVQNRVSVAEPRLPEEVRRFGVTVRKNSPDLMLVIHLTSPNGTFDQQYISNYATLNIKDVLTRIDGVGEARVFGARDYSMRIWLDPGRIAERELIPEDILSALRGSNLQVAAGAINQPPASSDGAFEVSVQTLGRLTDPDQFGNIVIQRDEEGRVVRLRDVARIELGAQDYSINALLDNQVATAIVIFQRPGSNALETAEQIKQTVAGLAQDFPAGLEYSIVYNPTDFIQRSIDEVEKTFWEALVLVVIVVILFLQSWRAAVIPLVAIPVSLVGTFLVMSAFGFSLNNLSLFGLVLAIGIVVDDAIVVVENVERNIGLGMSPRDAAFKTMDEVTGALIATTLVLVAVFVPTAFITGISGAFYKQFALTIAGSTVISSIVSLTLSPALSAILLKPRRAEGDSRTFSDILFGWFFKLFNKGFDGLSTFYAGLTRRMIRISALVLIVYAGLIYGAFDQFQKTPTGFIPQLDRGYFITAFQLPPGSTLDRTDAVIRRAGEILKSRPGVKHAVGFAGFDGATFTNAPNAGVIFVALDEFEDRVAQSLTWDGILSDLRQQMGAIQEAGIFVIPPPSVPGIGTGGGFKLYVQDKAARGPRALEQATWALAGPANGVSGLVQVFTLFNTSTPQIYADINRVKAEMLGVPVPRVFDALSVYMGSVFVNDFNILGRTYRVTAQADNPYRQTVRDVANLRTRSIFGGMVPLGSVASFEDTTGPYRVPRYNLFPAAEVQGATLPGFSTGQAIEAMEKLAATNLPSGFGFEWTELALQEKLAGDTAFIAFSLAVVFVFLVLAAQYESITLPLAVVLIVPMCLLSAILGVNFRGLDNNILTQVGFVVLVALAAKNAILIVEFAKQGEDEGLTRLEAAVQAGKDRLRPIMMTSFAFILGVIPLVIATGAGAEMRQALGTAVFYGMLGVTLFGLLFTPIFYVLCRALRGLVGGKAQNAAGLPQD